MSESDGFLESARSSVARTVNTTQVIANWMIGREIVEEVQKGKRRAEYAQQLLPDLSARLTAEYGRGYSVDNLEFFRLFFLEYNSLLGSEKSDALRRISIHDRHFRRSASEIHGEQHSPVSSRTTRAA